jgi:hypothetical protein
MERTNRPKEDNRDVRTPINVIVHYAPRSKEYCAALDLKHMVMETDGTGVVWHERGIKTKMA